MKFIYKLRDLLLIVFITALLLVSSDYFLKGYAAELKQIQDDYQPVSQPIHRSKLPLEYYEIDQKILWENNDVLMEEGFKKSTFHPYYHYKSAEVSTRYANIDSDGIRKTIKNPHKNAKKIFMFGGSTLWGLGVADKYTIPSIMSEKLGPKFDITNFGEGSFVSGQELNLLLEQLNNGNVPDAVIFYDGVNDSYAGSYSPGIPGSITQHLQMQKVFKGYQEDPTLAAKNRSPFEYQLSHMRKKVDATSYGKIASYINFKIDNAVEFKKLDGKAKRVIDIYENRIKQIKAIADAYGFKAYIFWQPYLMSGIKEPLDFERDIIDALGPRWSQSISKVYEYARLSLSNRKIATYIL